MIQSAATALRSAGDTAWLTAKGFAIGTAGLIPGVSGGTMALLLGIYEHLVEAIRMASDPQTLKALIQRQWQTLLARLSWQILVPVGLGALAAVITISHFMEWLLHTYPVQVEAFFFGLVAASMVVVARKVRRWSVRLAAGFVLGAVAAWLLMDMTPAQTPETLWMLFLSGAVAKCAMVLPGISGAFVLIIFGQYQYALAAVTQRNLLGIGVILLGAVVGLVTFAQVLSWLFKKQHDVTLAVLGGLILGSLRKLWPWKESVAIAGVASAGVGGAAGDMLTQINVLPSAWTMEVAVALLLALGGFLLVLLLSLGRRNKAEH
jgi:putative membrane protein